MSLYIRFVNKKGDLVERWLALIKVPSIKAADLLETIHASMKTSQLDKSRDALLRPLLNPLEGPTM